MSKGYPELILYHGKVTTLDKQKSEVSAIALSDGVVTAIGNDAEILKLAGQGTQQINLQGKRVIPGLNDSHLHLIRGGLNYNMELRWDGVVRLADALMILKVQAERTPNPQWVRVVGGWSEFQFKERRMPTLAEINHAAPNTPVFILHLYDRALLNGAALKAAGITRESPDPIGGRIERDKKGNPTGMLIAEPNAMILYSTLAKGPKLPFEHQVNSTRHFMRELNRLGITSCIDAGGGFQNYPEDYQVIEKLHQEGLMTVRIAYNLFTQNPGRELADFQQWTKQINPYSGDGFYRHNGAGEMLVFSAADFEDFLQPRPDMPGKMEDELKDVVRFLVDQRWPFRLHATYNETIDRALTVFESVNKDTAFDGLRWFFDHAETVDEHNLERIKKLGGGIAVQHRMAFQGEYFVERYGKEAAQNAPPIRKMLDMGIPVGGGTDATRVASYNPFVSLYWLITGKTVGGLSLYRDNNRLEREEALRLWTQGSAYKSNEETVKGALSVGQYADLAVLSDDFMHVADEAIKAITSVLTVVGGKIVYAAEEFKSFDPPMPPPSPEWSPVAHYGGYAAPHWHGSSCMIHGHDGKLSRCLGLNKTAHHRPNFANPWALGCGCFAY
ncbi:TPA: amidohydrolase [Legionella pneumophila]|uniref:amidohydrolase n=1 Tax=Legionella pneumophila TaxID=446 RepID=UPI000788E374|nr:amidohydrolase [Legionella pneumophila]HAU1193329.1 amidohydrolase [Legionella pneumophila]HBD7103594.1 amidohydrolase [Legionella pneumophila]HCO4740250.1 amidohydrolase [Legionella pneumophila]HDU7931059.1 amidohydrolase [Legionella pneumophila]HDU7937128.1 amidohydrolase [Legionella pneumophila]